MCVPLTIKSWIRVTIHDARLDQSECIAWVIFSRTTRPKGRGKGLASQQTKRYRPNRINERKWDKEERHRDIEKTKLKAINPTNGEVW